MKPPPARKKARRKARKCPKCDGSAMHVNWHVGMAHYYHEEYDSRRPKCARDAVATSAGEHLHITCTTCHFEWTENAADA